MITFISEKQASEFVLYKKNEFIEKNTLKSFTGNEYIQEYCETPSSKKYLKKILFMGIYIINILELYILILREKKLLKEIELQLIDEQNNCLTIKDIKYRNAKARIESGKKIYYEVNNLLKSDFIDENLKNLVHKTDELRKKLSCENGTETEYYSYKMPEEADIYHYYLLDCKEELESVFPKFFTCDFHYTNVGNSVFVLGIKEYLYIVGETRGKILGEINFKYFMNEIEKDIDISIFEFIVSELKNLKEEIDNKLLFFAKKEDSNLLSNNDFPFEYTFTNEIRKTMFFNLKENEHFKNIINIVPNFYDYCYILIDCNYLKYENDKLCSVTYPNGKKTKKMFPDYYFFRFLNDSTFDLYFQLNTIKNDYEKLINVKLVNNRSCDGYSNEFQTFFDKKFEELESKKNKI